MGFALATHYCSGLAVESKLVFGHEELACGMEKIEEPTCHSAPEPKSEEKGCCENEYQSLDVEDEFKPSTTIFLSNIQIEYAAIIVTVFLGLPFPIEEQVSKYTHYLPPLIEQDKHVLFQVFLI